MGDKMEKKEKFDQEMEVLSKSGEEEEEEEEEEEYPVNILDEWDSDDGICSSRSPKTTCIRVGKTVLFLFCFFVFLVMFSIGVMVLFNYLFNGRRNGEEHFLEKPTTTEEMPIYVQVTTQKKRVPTTDRVTTTDMDVVEYDPTKLHLSFEPRIDKDHLSIRCTYDPSGTRPYVRRMTSAIKNLNLNSPNSEECGKNITGNKLKSCRFSMSQLGNVCVKKRKYGFNDCRICVGLTLNKLLDWVPIAYDNESIPMEIQDRYNPEAVTVSCHGIKLHDDNYMGPVSFYPAEGFPFKYFPYQGQYDYNTPMVMVHFKKPSKFMYIDVECKAWAKNIDHSKNEGVVKFEIYLE